MTKVKIKGAIILYYSFTILFTVIYFIYNAFKMIHSFIAFYLYIFLCSITSIFRIIFLGLRKVIIK